MAPLEENTRGHSLRLFLMTIQRLNFWRNTMKIFNTAMYIAFEKALAATPEHTKLTGKVFRALRANARYQRRG